MAHRRLGILTSGGDCPGLNAVIRAVAKTAIHRYGMEVVGLRDGFEGLIYDRVVPLNFDDVSSILTEGGTILGTVNRGSFARRTDPRYPQTKKFYTDARHTFRKYRLDGVVCIGGDGSLSIANQVNEAGIPTIGVPKTIDNDVAETDQTFGFDTASSVAALAVDRLHSTAESHGRVMVIEVMGRNAGWIALQAGIAGGGDVILIPEIPYRLEAIAAYVRKRFASGRRYAIIVVAEGAHPVGRRPVFQRSTHTARLGGVSQLLAYEIQKATGIESRATILGYLQRGGTPTPFDRVLATRYGHHAAVLAAERRYGRMTSLKNNQITSVPLGAVADKPRLVPTDSVLITAARDIGTFFGA